MRANCPRPLSGAVSALRRTLPGFALTALTTTLAMLALEAPAKAQNEPPAAPAHLTVEQIYGSPSLLEKIPSSIRWAGKRHAVSYITNVSFEDSTHRALVVRTVPAGKETILCIPDTAAVPEDLATSDDTRLRIAMYSWDKQGRRVVFSSAGELFTLDAKTRRIERRTHAPGRERDPSFSPDGKKIAFSRDNDLFVVNLDDNTEVRLTATGSDSVLNGILDWVYMEELFTRGHVKSFWWSPDSKRLAFLEIREHPVPEFPLVDWIPLHATYKLQHYPKAGDPNPIVRVGMVNAGGGEITWADTDTSDDSYIARVYWLGDSRSVAIEKLNRAQDQLDLLFASAKSGRIEEVFQETSPTWVNINYLKHYYENKRQFVWGSERDGHSHLYLYNLDGTVIRQLTRGNWEVTALNGVDEKRGKIYFTANEGDIRERHLYVVPERGGTIRRITRQSGTHSVTLSTDRRYYIDRFSTAARPSRVAVYDIKGKEVFELGDRMGEKLRAIKRPTPEFFTIERDSRTYYCMITRPADFDPGRRYPVIVYVYGGPHAQVVRNAWSRHHLWHSMMAQRGYIVFSLDNRGSFGRGKAWEDAVLRNFGQHELEDQLAGVEYLKEQPWVDPDRIGVWGWSFGGYMTLMSLFKAPDVFRAGVSVAPVSDWHLYDSIYTERYMKRPADNEEGYAESAPLNFVDGYAGRLLLMHGDADDNVHVQNSIKLVRKLIDAGKDFDLMIYPQKYHGISGSKNRVHLYRKMTAFFDRYLAPDESSPARPAPAQ